MNDLTLGDCVEKLKDIPDNSVDAIVTDPPYELGFMGKKWDNTGIANSVEMWGECLRVLKPGGHLLSFGGTRTYHRMASAIEDAGFEVRNQIIWAFGSGFPKSSRINANPKFCQCVLTGRNGESTNPLQQQGDHNNKVLGEHDDDPALLSADHLKNEDANFQGDYQQDCDSNDAQPLDILSHDQEPSPLQEYAQEHNHSSLPDDVQVSESLHNPSLAQYNDRPSSQDYSHRKEVSSEQKDILSDHKLPVGSFYKADHKQHNLDNSYIKYTNGFPVCQVCGKPNADGWGTQLKPAFEPICMAMKPLSEKNFALNVLKYGTGGINIDESRVESKPRLTGTLNKGDEIKAEPTSFKGSGTRKLQTGYDEKMAESNLGRFPANLCWSCDCDNNYLTGNALFDILNNISNQIKLCQLNNSNSNALNVEQKKHQQDTTSEEKKLCFAVENVDTLFLEKILGKTLEVIFSVDTECSVEMLEESMNTSLSISLSGNEKMEEYQKVLKYITLTAIKLITELKTCNLSQSQIIGSFITKVISGIREQSQVKSHSQDCWVRECFPETKSGAVKNTTNNFNGSNNVNIGGGMLSPENSYGDSGNASRFFKSIIYQAKASKSERNCGLDVIEDKNKRPQGEAFGDGSAITEHSERKGNFHPTVKPIALMEYLINMVTREGQTVLDPFMGSGTTGVACKNLGRSFIGIEIEEEYFKIAEKRIAGVLERLFV